MFFLCGVLKAHMAFYAAAAGRMAAFLPPPSSPLLKMREIFLKGPRCACGKLASVVKNAQKKPQRETHNSVKGTEDTARSRVNFCSLLVHHPRMEGTAGGGGGRQQAGQNTVAL